MNVMDLPVLVQMNGIRYYHLEQPFQWPLQDVIEVSYIRGNWKWISLISITVLYGSAQ